MDPCGSYSPAGETVALSSFFCHGENLFIEVETTAPPPKRRSRRRRFIRGRTRLDELEGTGGGWGGGPGSSAGLGGGMGGSPGRHQPMSASSRDGGDEYSSEASEYDTYGTIPAWIKQELRDVDDDDVGNDAEVDDMSDHSDDDVIRKSDVHDSSMSSIQINKDLAHGHRAKSDRSPREGGGTRNKVGDGSTGKQTSSTESGVDLNGDHLSSSSSSEHGSLGDEKPKVPRPTAKPPGPQAPQPPRKVTGPQPYKSKLGPQAQKPLNRIRAQNKGTRSRLSAEGKDGVPPKSADSSTRSSTYHNIQVELKKMKEEKAATEAKLKKLEEEYRRREDDRARETERKSDEKEKELKGEIVNLRDELRNQSAQMKNNNDLVRELQNRLEQVQSEQLRISQNPPRPASRQSVRESKICNLQ